VLSHSSVAGGEEEERGERERQKKERGRGVERQ